MLTHFPPGIQDEFLSFPDGSSPQNPEVSHVLGLAWALLGFSDPLNSRRIVLCPIDNDVVNQQQ
jgi:hypothetical protein